MNMTQERTIPDFLTIEQVANKLSVSISTVNRLLDRGFLERIRLPGLSRGRSMAVRVSTESLERYIASGNIDQPEVD